MKEINDKLNKVKEENKHIRQKNREELKMKKEKEREKKKEEGTEIENIKKNEIPPGPGEYNISYNQVEFDGPLYSFRPKLKSELFIKKDDDVDKRNEFESTGYSLKNPDFNIVKESFPRFIMPKSDRFNYTYGSNINSIHSYGNYEEEFREKSKDISLYKDKSNPRNTFFGTANRFIGGYSKNVPGPNNYKIEGFAESRVRFYKMRDDMRKGNAFLIDKNKNKTHNKQNNENRSNLSLYDKDSNIDIKDNDFKSNMKIKENDTNRITTIHGKHNYESEDEDNKSVNMFELN